jgi:exosortase
MTDAYRPDDAAIWRFDRAFWLKVGIISLLFVLIFWHNLLRLWLKTNPFFGEPNWGHAIAVPFIGLYYLYTNREDLASAKSRPSWVGLAILLLGIMVWEYGIWPGKNDYVSDFGIVVTLFGVVLLLCGWGVMKIAWFPIAFLICALPWPQLLYSRVAWPLQVLAAKVAVQTLKMTGVNASDNGATKIFIQNTFGQVRTLNVAEACAGLRSLMTFITLAAAIAFLSSRPLWQKIIITLSAIPIAIFCNVARIAGQGLLDTYWSREVSEGFAHQFVGLVMLAPAFFLILLVGWILDNLFIEEVDRPIESRGKSPKAAESSHGMPSRVNPPPPSVSLRARNDRKSPPAGDQDKSETP